MNWCLLSFGRCTVAFGYFYVDLTAPDHSPVDSLTEGPAQVAWLWASAETTSPIASILPYPSVHRRRSVSRGSHIFRRSCAPGAGLDGPRDGGSRSRGGRPPADERRGAISARRAHQHAGLHANATRVSHRATDADSGRVALGGANGSHAFRGSWRNELVAPECGGPCAPSARYLAKRAPCATRRGWLTPHGHRDARSRRARSSPPR